MTMTKPSLASANREEGLPIAEQIVT